MTQNRFHLSDKDAILCGWGPTAEHEIHSNSLRCVTIQIQSWRSCASFNYRKGFDYQHRYHCGYVGREKKLTLVIELINCVFLYNFMNITSLR